MPDSPSDDGSVTADVEHNTVSASGIVAAEPSEVFDFLRRPANHPEISGDASVRGTISGPELLGAGDSFGMKMHLGLPYRVKSKVVEFEPARRIAWCHLGGHRWRWEVEPVGAGQTRVTETFDMSTSRFPPALRLAGYPRRHEKNVTTSVRNVISHFAPVG
jgi:uncharacterized protein YndB with AHSA1/START domain